MTEADLLHGLDAMVLAHGGRPFGAVKPHFPDDDSFDNAEAYIRARTEAQRHEPIGQNKLSNQQKSLILLRRLGGATMKDLAGEFGVCISTIHRILHG